MRPRKTKRDAILGHVASRGDRRTPMAVITAKVAWAVNVVRAGQALVATISGRCPLIASDEQRKLLHPVIINSFDGTTKLAFAKANPWLWGGAIENLG